MVAQPVWQALLAALVAAHGLTSVAALVQRTTRWSRAVVGGSVGLVEASGATPLRMVAGPEEENPFGSKLMADVSEDELEELFKEFNITNFSVEKDSELQKWAPSKEFFEKFAFQNMTERYKRKVMDVKIDFYAAYNKPILPQYKTFIADLMSMTYTQTVDSRYKYDALHAFGICTQYYTIMKGYAMQEEVRSSDWDSGTVNRLLYFATLSLLTPSSPLLSSPPLPSPFQIDVIFNTMMKCVGLDPNRIRDDAKRVLTLIKEGPQSEDAVLSATSGEMAEIFNTVRTNRFFKYTDAWGVGLGRMMELLGVEPKQENFDKWSKNLKWIFTQRLIQTWDEFSGDQLRMQGVEGMQKQLLIREKKRAAARLEAKAASFDDKKKALQELNDAIDERRQQLIQEQKALKKKYEPEEYDRILAQDAAASA